MFKDEQIKGNLTSTDRMLLWDIRELLRDQNGLLKSLLSNEKQQANDIVPETKPVETKQEAKKAQNNQRRSNK